MIGYNITVWGEKQRYEKSVMYAEHAHKKDTKIT